MLFQKLFDHTPLSYEQVVILKNLVLYIGGIFTGLLIGLLLYVWIIKNSIRDRDLPAVEIMKIKRGSKNVIVLNPQKTGQVIHAIFIMIGWKLNLIKNNNIFYKDAKKSKIAYRIFVVVLSLIVLTSFSWIIEIVQGDQ